MVFTLSKGFGSEKKKLSDTCLEQDMYEHTILELPISVNTRYMQIWKWMSEWHKMSRCEREIEDGIHVILRQSDKLYSCRQIGSLLSISCLEEQSVYVCCEDSWTAKTTLKGSGCRTLQG